MTADPVFSFRTGWWQTRFRDGIRKQCRPGARGHQAGVGLLQEQGRGCLACLLVMIVGCNSTTAFARTIEFIAWQLVRCFDAAAQYVDDTGDCFDRERTLPKLLFLTFISNDPCCAKKAPLPQLRIRCLPEPPAVTRRSKPPPSVETLRERLQRSRMSSSLRSWPWAICLSHDVPIDC